MWLAEFSDALVKIGKQDLNPANRNAQLSCLVSLAVYRKDAQMACNLIQEALEAAKHPECDQVCFTFLLFSMLITISSYKRFVRLHWEGVLEWMERGICN
jgi:hypothetical protein